MKHYLQSFFVDRSQRDSMRKHLAHDRKIRRKCPSIVISFPKSGRTWHRLSIGACLAHHIGEPDHNPFDLKGMCRTAGSPRIGYSHNGSNFNDGLDTSNPVIASPALWKGRRVMLLVRNPRDVLVSAYFHARFRDGTFEGTISDFVRSPRLGIDKILTATNRWSSERHQAEMFDVLSYEQMHASPEHALARTMEFLGVEGVSPASIAAAVAFSSFEKMKIYEENNTFGAHRLYNKGGRVESAKVRSGRVGSYREHLNEDDLAYLERRIAALGDPFADKYMPARVTSAA